MEPSDWFRLRHADPFPPEAVAAFKAGCSVFRARIEAILEHWDELPTMGTGPKPVVTFFEPELSEDARVLSLPLRVENKTLSSRSLLQNTASRELYTYLPLQTMHGVEVGLTEPALEGSGWRHDWWDPHRAAPSLSSEEVWQKLGFTVKADPNDPGRSYIIPGWRRRLQWLFQRIRRS